MSYKVEILSPSRVVLYTMPINHHTAGHVRGKPRQDIFEVCIRVVPVHSCRLDQAHDDRRLARKLPANNQLALPRAIKSYLKK